MSKSIQQLEPESIWKHFYDLTQIPRPSGREEAVAAHIEAFARSRGLECLIDEAGNVIVKKAAIPGRDQAKGVILQTHLDMVPQKNSDTEHNFLTDPIETIIDGEWVRANKTTLGADNGIGIAAALAVLESGDIQHGPIEALFTISEETGMDGAFALDAKALSGDILLNLDSEEEGELFIGCAGGVDVNVNTRYTTDPVPERSAVRISVGGLKGGHSGMDIHLGRANANLLLLETIRMLSEKLDLRIHSFSGGNLRNAIPREAEAIVALEGDSLTGFDIVFGDIAEKLQNEYARTEPDMQFRSNPVKSVSEAVAAEDQVRLLEKLQSCPNGVLKMSEQMQGVVQTSSNLAILRMEGGDVNLQLLLRSASDSEKEEVVEKIREHFSNLEATTESSGSYPGWLPNSNSEILGKARVVYEGLYNAEPRVMVIHAGLECGIIAGKYPGLDMLSFGPTIKYPHSPDEKVHIASVGRFWQFLRALLEAV